MKKIAIIGAGISGLILGNFLKSKSINFKIFEKKSEIDFTEGYGIQLGINSIQILNKIGFKNFDHNFLHNPKKIIIKSGEAVRVFTGARMPSNSSTVVMQENVIKEGQNIRLLKIPLFGENSRSKGEDIKKNKKILLKGTIINQQNLNLIAAIGIRKIKVYKKIKIGFFTSGNELRRPTNKL